MTRVFIADDHTIFRQGVRQLLASVSDVSVIGEAADGRAVLNAAETTEFDVLLLDLSLPKVSGTEVLRRVRALRPAVRIIVLSMYPEEQYARGVLQEGASEYLSKHRPAEDLIAAIRRTEPGADPKPAPRQAPHHTLSAREYQVFTLLVEGRMVTEIAAELDLSQSTVSGFVANIRNKLKVRTIAEIVTYAHRAGLTS